MTRSELYGDQSKVHGVSFEEIADEWVKARAVKGRSSMLLAIGHELVESGDLQGLSSDDIVRRLGAPDLGDATPMHPNIEPREVSYELAPGVSLQIKYEHDRCTAARVYRM